MAPELSFVGAGGGLIQPPRNRYPCVFTRAPARRRLPLARPVVMLIGGPAACPNHVSPPPAPVLLHVSSRPCHVARRRGPLNLSKIAFTSVTDDAMEEIAIRKSAMEKAQTKNDLSGLNTAPGSTTRELRTGVAEVTTSEKLEIVLPTEEDDQDQTPGMDDKPLSPGSTESIPPPISPGSSPTEPSTLLRKLSVIVEPFFKRNPFVEKAQDIWWTVGKTVDETSVRLRQAFGNLTAGESATFSIPTREQALVLLSELTLVLGLLLLLRAGVSQTLRWIHGRLDPNRLTLPYEQSVFECMQRPLEFLSVFTVGTSVAEAVSRPLAATGLLRYIRAFRELGVIFAATWFLLRWIERIRSRFVADVRVDKAQVDTISRIATVVTAAISVLISFDTLGINIQTVLAFGGIGGVAIGFAGREIISNFFSGFMIYVTRPFTVGEWIRSIENKELDGTVEEIGWYMTRVRTWDKRPLYIPNSRFSTLVVETPSRMTNRRIKHTIHIRLEDMNVVHLICKDLERSLLQNQDLDPRQHRMVYVEGFFGHSVGLWLSCFTKTVFMSEFRRVQQDVLLDAFQIIRSRGGRIASDLIRDLREGANPDKYSPSSPLIEDERRDKTDEPNEPVPSNSAEVKANTPVPSDPGTMRIHGADKATEDSSTVVLAEVVTDEVSPSASPASAKSSNEWDMKNDPPLEGGTKRSAKKYEEQKAEIGSEVTAAVESPAVTEPGTMRIARASVPPSRPSKPSKADAPKIAPDSKTTPSDTGKSSSQETVSRSKSPNQGETGEKGRPSAAVEDE